MIYQKPVFLYRMFDRSNKLLYIGISQSFFNRVDQHSAEKDWFVDVWVITAERFDTREEALQHEKQAIQNEKPIHNIIHNTKDVLRPTEVAQSGRTGGDPLIGKLVTEHEPWNGLDVDGLGFQGAIDYRLDNGYYAVRKLSYWDGADMYLKLFTTDELAKFAIYDTSDDLSLYIEKHTIWQRDRVRFLIWRLIYVESFETFTVPLLQMLIAKQFETQVAQSLIEQWISDMKDRGALRQLDDQPGTYLLVDEVTA